MAHYTWYNLSPQGKTISSITVSVLGSAAEAIVFAYIGLCVFTYATKSTSGNRSDHVWSASFICWMVAIIIVGRISAISIAHTLFGLCSRGKSDYNCKELIFIMYGGMIRGAIAFALVLKIPSDGCPDNCDFHERGVVVTTTLAAVIITTVGFGSFMPVIQKVLVPPKLEDKTEYDAGFEGEEDFEFDDGNIETRNSNFD
jgi:sodium/hydrogen exchanger-like protein 6/7/sodium/hydrogen exchanger 8